MPSGRKEHLSEGSSKKKTTEQFLGTSPLRQGSSKR